jgi:hypothetical protein
MNIELNIEEVVLQGFREADKEILVTAFRNELTRLISEEGLSEIITDGESFRLEGGSFTVPPGRSIGESGEHVATEIYARWCRKKIENK